VPTAPRPLSWSAVNLTQRRLETAVDRTIESVITAR